MRNNLINFIAILAVIAVAMTSFPYSAFAAPAEEVPAPDGEGTLLTNTATDEDLTDYKDYIKQNEKAPYATEADNVIVDGSLGVYTQEEGKDGTATAENDYKVKADGKEETRNVLNWQGGRGTVTYTVNVPASAFYNFYLEYLPPETGVNTEIGILFDGATEFLFDGADSIEFTRDWINVSDEFREDAHGNQLAPEQKTTGELVERLATDNTGVQVEPYLFYLTAGEHTFTLVGLGHTVIISKLGFTAPEKAPSYEEYFDESKLTENKDVKDIVIQGEDATLKNDNSLIPKSTNGNVDMQPVDPYLTLINNIGGSSWGSTGQQITWEFEVETAGYYSFGARYKQSDVVNGESWRWLRVDGKTPFEEAKSVRFAYSTQWEEYVFGENTDDETVPYYIWLDKGTHTISLEVTLAEMAEAYDRLYDIVQAIGDMYLQIVMITSESPDINRDYELFRQIPTFTEVLEKASADLKSLVKDMQDLTGARGSQYIAAMNNMDRVINQMLDARFIAHIYVKDYYTNYTTLSSWLSEMKKLPVSIDEMRLTYAGNDAEYAKANFFQSFWFEVLRLYSSFANDYTLYKEGEDDGVTLKMWVNWGRDQTMALNSLIQDSFTAENGIGVNLQIVSASLINGLLADNFPDVQLHLSRTDPVNYGMRGALLDLTQFDDYKEVLSRFQEGADMPYWYNNQLFAIPDTQSFFCMFYRTDVFEDLGLTVPKTWEEFLYCATIIQRYNMNVYVPYVQITTATTVNQGIGSLHLYPSMLQQNGLTLYNDEHNATAIDNVRAIQVFEEWTEMYTDYGYQKEADFYNRLRNGSMPLGIAPYATYMTIYSAAPEIDGRWTVANVPGTYDENGNLNQTIAGSGSGAAIVKASSHHDEAWEFLKWWTSAETQSRYSNNVESILGMLGRVATANVEAFEKLAWDPNDLELLLDQWDEVQELPELPGSYYTTRAVDQAFWSVLNNGINAKDAINKWSLVADNEIKRKIEEYS